MQNKKKTLMKALFSGEVNQAKLNKKDLEFLLAKVFVSFKNDYPPDDLTIGPNSRLSWSQWILHNCRSYFLMAILKKSPLLHPGDPLIDKGINLSKVC